MAKSLVKREYHSDAAMVSGVITFSNVADADDSITFDIGKLCGFSKAAWKDLPEYTRWSLLRDANNTHGDSFSADAGAFKALAQARHDKLAGGEFGRGGGDGAPKGMNDDIRALMVVANLEEPAAREYVEALDTETKQENGLTAYEEFKSHAQIKNAKQKIRDARAADRAKKLEKDAAEAGAFKM